MASCFSTRPATSETCVEHFAHVEDSDEGCQQLVDDGETSQPRQLFVGRFRDSSPLFVRHDGGWQSVAPLDAFRKGRGGMSWPAMASPARSCASA